VLLTVDADDAVAVALAPVEPVPVDDAATDAVAVPLTVAWAVWVAEPVADTVN
jgi:hypothetical protein